MEHSINILFHCRISHANESGLVPVYIRITVNGKRIEQSINRSIELSKWSAETGKLMDKSKEATLFNNHLDTLKNKVYTYERELILEGKPVTFESFRNKWLGIAEKPRMLMEVFKQHNEQMEELVGRDYANGTLDRYKTSFAHTAAFLEWKYKLKDIDIKKLDYEFITGYEFWLKTRRNCSHNTTMKYLANFKKIVIGCMRKGWLTRDPFLGFKMSKKEVERGYLTETELQTMAEKEFAVERLNQVRDIFLFSCFTGLAYADVKKLKRSEIAVGVDGEKWIFTKRQKTETASRIPVLPFAETLLEKYKENIQCKAKDLLLPVLSNQKMNAYLKEIADVCGIHKNLTYHIARHTFATTVTLSNGVPIESVSKMLGHTNLKTTQHYAKILDMKVSLDMSKLRQKYGKADITSQRDLSIGS